MSRQPVRLQLSRKKGFNLQALSRATNGLEAVRVARPSRWGNPWRVENIVGGQRYARLLGSDWSVASDFLWHKFFDKGPIRDVAGIAFTRAANEAAVSMYRGLLLSIAQVEPEALSEFIRPLIGRNLGCYCQLRLPCHADVLLEIANR
jgi:hypothetical protein